MKIRNGFVSNSSSSSFMIRVDRLNEGQLEILHSLDSTSEKIKKVMNHTHDFYTENPKYKKILSEIEWGDMPWLIYEKNNILYGDTFMDNGSMSELMKKINIDPSDIIWENQP